MKTHSEEHTGMLTHAHLYRHIHTCIHSLCLIKNQARTVSKQQTEGDFRREDTIEVGLTVSGRMFHFKFSRDRQRDKNTIRSKGICKQGEQNEVNSFWMWTKKKNSEWLPDHQFSGGYRSFKIGMELLNVLKQFE